MANRSLVIVPTYNEIENITQILTALAEKAPEVDVLVVDDSSPDGTAAAVANFANSHSNVHLLSREKKNG